VLLQSHHRNSKFKKPHQKPGDIVMPGGNIKDAEKLRGLLPK
jgi:hypothetical protein